MVNKNYIRGSCKEREIVNYFRSKGYLGIRSAGSKSAIDVMLVPCSIPTDEVKLIQVKRVKLKHTNLLNLFPEALTLSKYTYPNNISVEYWVYIDYEGWEIYKYKDNEFKLIKSIVSINDYF